MRARQAQQGAINQARCPCVALCGVLCMCQKYEDAAAQAASSRLYGGIHINIDNTDGLKLGTRLGETVAAALARLSPAFTMPNSECSLWVAVADHMACLCAAARLQETACTSSLEVEGYSNPDVAPTTQL